MESAVKADVTYPEMRNEVISALESLSDANHQRTVWLRPGSIPNYYDDLTLCSHILYDDCRVLPDPQVSVPAVLHQEEISAFAKLEHALGPMIDELGDRPDEDYLNDPRWPSVVEAARVALEVMKAAEGE
jgi:hypothetical protein